MAQQNIVIGTADGGTGDTYFDAFTKTEANFTEVFNSIDSIGVIFIGGESDFEIQNATIITLEANRTYFITASFSTVKKFDCNAGNISVVASNQFGVMITYTGSSDMFTGVDVNFNINFIGLSAPNGQVFNFSDSALVNTNIFWCANVVITDCAKVGSFTSMASFVFVETSGTSDIDDGISIFGTGWRVWRVQNAGFITNKPTFIGIDLGTAVSSAVGFGPMIVVNQGGAGAVGISGLINSGNIVVGGIGRVNQTNYIGNVTPLVGITSLDVRWEFQENSIIPDSVNEADLYLTGGAETITTGSAGDWQEIGTPSGGGVSWASDIASRFTISSSGVMTYIGERELRIRVSGRVTVEKVGGGSNIIEVRIAQNWDGTASDSGIEKSRAQTQNTDPSSVPVGALVDLFTNDNIRLIFSNIDGTSNIIADVSSVEIA